MQLTNDNAGWKLELIKITLVMEIITTAEYYLEKLD
jgi:hypothetical protein